MQLVLLYPRLVLLQPVLTKKKEVSDSHFFYRQLQTSWLDILRQFVWVFVWVISCGYTCLLSKVTLWVIALGWERSGFPVRFIPPVTLQIITQDQLLTWQYLAGNLIHHGDRKPRNKGLACGRSSAASHTAIPGRFSYPKLRLTKNLMRRRRLRLRFLQSLQLLYLFYRTRRLQVARRSTRAWVFARPQNWFQELLINRALDHWWKENFRVSRATFEFIYRLVGPAIARRNTRMRGYLPEFQSCTTKMCCGFQNYIFLTPDWLNCSCG